nr:MAG TPA: hypothetical protein [Caudoviricetes sp.]
MLLCYYKKLFYSILFILLPCNKGGKTKRINMWLA